MNLKLYQVDAFADRPFEGNPAAVVPLESWPDDRTLQLIAAENNLAETAFFVPDGEGYHLRWFTPEVEVPLCGHATLASAHVLMTHLEPGQELVRFSTLSGELKVTREASGLLVMDFPANPPKPSTEPEGVAKALGRSPRMVLKSTHLLFVYDRADDVRSLRPNLAALKQALTPLDALLIVTAPADAGSEFDFVSRVFAPAHGIDEDAVTGSAHCTLTPFWSKRLGKTELTGRQVSARGGTVICVDAGPRTFLKGRCADYMEGTIRLS